MLGAMWKLLVAGGIALALAGCSPAVSGTNEKRDEVSQEAAEPHTEPADPAAADLRYELPDGYPQVVSTSDIPEHMRPEFDATGTGQAVAVAPGVWAALAPGASVEDAVNLGAFSGFCSSKEAFERDYLNGEATAGSCW